jgi:hypothetical protein
MDRELSRRHGAVLYLPNRKAGRGKGAAGMFILVDLESTVSAGWWTMEYRIVLEN